MISSLIGKLHDPDGLVRQIVPQGLAKIGSDANPALVSAVFI